MEKFYEWLKVNYAPAQLRSNGQLTIDGEYDAAPLMLIGYKLKYLSEHAFEGELTINSILDNTLLDEMIKRVDNGQ